MSFYSELQERNLTQILYGTTYKTVVPIGGVKFAQQIKDIVENNKSVYLDEDCDIDGYLSVLSLKSMFDAIGFTNYYIPVHVYKRHGVTVDILRPFINEHKFDYYIVTDSSINNTDVFNMFTQYNDINLIVVDHHKTNINRHNYDNTNVLLINPKLDTNELGRVSLAQEMSACAVISLLIDYTMKTYFKEYYDRMHGCHFVYGYISLYSDVCRFNPYNIAYARNVLNSHFKYPKLVELFMDKYSELDRSFVCFNLNPRLNALFRDEYFSLAHKVFYDTQSVIDNKDLDTIETIYQESKKMSNHLASNTTDYERDNYVLSILPNVPRARNYTGMVANIVSAKYNKPTMVLLKVDSDVYEGSVRDLYSRNLLSVFSTVMYAEGHESAFGVKLKKENMEDILYLLDDLLKNVYTNNSGIILMDWSIYNSTSKELKDDIQLMQEFNEYAGQGDIPSAYAKIPIRANMSIKYGAKRTLINWGGIEMILFNKYISEGDTAIVMPIYPGRIIVKNVHYHI